MSPYALRRLSSPNISVRDRRLIYNNIGAKVGWFGGTKRVITVLIHACMTCGIFHTNIRSCIYCYTPGHTQDCPRSTPRNCRRSLFWKNHHTCVLRAQWWLPEDVYRGLSKYVSASPLLEVGWKRHCSHNRFPLIIMNSNIFGPQEYCNIKAIWALCYPAISGFRCRLFTYSITKIQPRFQNVPNIKEEPTYSLLTFSRIISREVNPQEVIAKEVIPFLSSHRKLS